jgi:hypothetical protein
LVRGMPRAEGPPTFARGRKGSTSLLDTLVESLWQSKVGGKLVWPSKSFTQLREEASRSQGYAIQPSTIRSTIYLRPDLFERVAPRSTSLLWRLTSKARGHER